MYHRRDYNSFDISQPNYPNFFVRTDHESLTSEYFFLEGVYFEAVVIMEMTVAEVGAVELVLLIFEKMAVVVGDELDVESGKDLEDVNNTIDQDMSMSGVVFERSL